MSDPIFVLSVQKSDLVGHVSYKKNALSWSSESIVFIILFLSPYIFHVCLTYCVTLKIHFEGNSVDWRWVKSLYQRFSPGPVV